MRVPYSFFRKGQRESIEALRSNLGKYLALRAPTGYGKTLVALMAHAGSGRVLYAVRTRNEIAPVVREARRVGASFTVVFSGRRMCPLVRGAEVPAEDFWLNCRLLRVKGMCPYYHNLRSVSYRELAELLSASTENDPHRLASLVVQETSACPFFALAGLSGHVNFTVATYPYLFNENVYTIAFQEVGLDEFYVVVDEAHTLVSPQSVLSDALDLGSLRACTRELSQEGYSKLSAELRPIEEVMLKARSRRLTRVSKEELGIDRELLDELEEALSEMRLSALSALEELGAEVFIKTASSVSKVVRFLDLAVREYFSLYTQLLLDEPRLHVLPLGYEPVKVRLAVAKGALMMSGTLPPKELLDRIVGRETVYIDVEREYGNVFPRENVFYAVYTPLTTSYTYRSTRMFMEYAKLVSAVFESVGRAVLAVYPSYEVMEEVVTYLSRSEGVYIENEQTRIGDVERFLRERPHTLVNAVAGGKIVEGVEFRDESGVSLIEAVVVCGVPYPYPDDYFEDFKSAIRKEVGEYADDIATDVQAAIRVAQACGRAIRSEADRAYIVLADRRYLKKSLRTVLGVKYDAVFTEIGSLLTSLKKFFGTY
jgi:DNA excision repair protein ERCC-2